ncbi:leucyl aminopeptidase family protein [Paenirhodobacter hankyongi]|uniref:Probable cytosol aminopeptidase n=1 Tax=Paenirhodobacter hankyongi TaxID=2294033 RepID=A0A421BKV7_9RHOB|nr:leucyl aminopeptidase family protein [Sinirhodobacter hankyongi]RLL63567.1 leucyl aminopeptidase family protein [Sinirhodobacter hankyongi]
MPVTLSAVATTSRTLVLPLDATLALGPRAAALDAAAGGAITRALAAARFTAAEGTCLDLFALPGLDAARIVVLGLGAPGAGALAAARAGAALARHLETAGESTATLIFDGTDAAQLAALVHGVRLGNYRFGLTAQGESPFALSLTLATDLEPGAALSRMEAVAEGVCLARDLVNYPASHLNPDSFADFLAPLAAAGIAIEVLDAEALARMGMNAVLAVGAGSARAPKVIVLRYRPAGSPVAPIALVGKGICFDAGGLAIKSGPQMFDMRADMSGAAAVAGTMLALARQGSREHVVGVLGIAENLLSGSSYKPGDIVTTFAGKTVEVYDTDCEGRMVLADILALAARSEPRVIVDLATLTYSVMQGLGHVFAGLFATDDGLAEALLRAGETVGERFWRLPLDPAYQEALRSPVADLRQHAEDLHDGDAPHAAAFLHAFTGGFPWAHLDIAGKELAAKEMPLARRGGTGFGVRLLEEWIAGLAPAEG